MARNLSSAMLELFASNQAASLVTAALPLSAVDDMSSPAPPVAAVDVEDGGAMLSTICWPRLSAAAMAAAAAAAAAAKLRDA